MYNDPGFGIPHNHLTAYSQGEMNAIGIIGVASVTVRLCVSEKYPTAFFSSWTTQARFDYGITVCL